MVVQGGFSLQLIDAETQQPLNEYRGPSGCVYYAEARPGAEYFLRFQVLQDEAKEEGDATKHDTMMYFRPSVDGKDLGFYTPLFAKDGPRDVGLWNFVNGIGTNQALKFDTEALPSTGSDKSTPAAAAGISNPVAVSDGESTSATGRKSPPLLLMGNVQVKISKGIFTGYQKRISTSVPALTQEETVATEVAAPISASSSLQEEEEDANTNGNSGANTDVASGSTNSKTADPIPILRSREGAAKFHHAFSEECPTYQPGELLETITIHYGSTAALIQAGILVPISGAVPEYVGVPPPATKVPPSAPSAVGTAPAPPALLTLSTANTQEKLLVPNPLLNSTSSAPKRPHSAVSDNEPATESKEEEIQQPIAKKPCHQATTTSEPTVAAVVSTK